MSWKIIVCTGLLCVIASSAWADPQVRIIQSGDDGTNQNWKIQVQPDGPLLWSNPELGGAEGGSITVEIDATFSTAVMSATPTTDLPDQNPGNNPFTGTTTTGIVVAGSTVFAAVGGPDDADPLFMPFGGDTDMDNFVFSSDFSTLAGNWDPLMTGAGVTGGRADGDFDSSGFVTSADFSTLAGNWNSTLWIDVADVTTTGLGGTAQWGGQAVTPAGGGDPYTSSRVAQAAINFDGISSAGSGSLGGGAVPEPTSLLLLVGGTLLLGGRRWNR